MTIREFFRKQWQPGDSVCELTLGGEVARLDDEYHALAAFRFRGIAVCAGCAIEHRGPGGRVVGYGSAARSMQALLQQERES